MQAIKDLIFGEDFKGFGDFKSYENGEKKYNKKRYYKLFCTVRLVNAEKFLRVTRTVC